MSLVRYNQTSKRNKRQRVCESNAPSEGSINTNNNDNESDGSIASRVKLRRRQAQSASRSISLATSERISPRSRSYNSLQRNQKLGAPKAAPSRKSKSNTQASQKSSAEAIKCSNPLPNQSKSHQSNASNAFIAFNACDASTSVTEAARERLTLENLQRRVNSQMLQLIEQSESVFNIVGVCLCQFLKLNESARSLARVSRSMRSMVQTVPFVRDISLYFGHVRYTSVEHDGVTYSFYNPDKFVSCLKAFNMRNVRHFEIQTCALISPQPTSSSNWLQRFQTVIAYLCGVLVHQMKHLESIHLQVDCFDQNLIQFVTRLLNNNVDSVTDVALLVSQNVEAHRVIQTESEKHAVTAKNEVIDGWISGILNNLSCDEIAWRNLHMSYMGPKTIKSLKRRKLNQMNLEIGEIECYDLKRLIRVLLKDYDRDAALSPTKSVMSLRSASTLNTFSLPPLPPRNSNNYNNNNNNNSSSSNNCNQSVGNIRNDGSPSLDMMELLCSANDGTDLNSQQNGMMSDSEDEVVNFELNNCNLSHLSITDFIDNWHAHVIAYCFRKIRNLSVPICGRLPNVYESDPLRGKMKKKKLSSSVGPAAPSGVSAAGMPAVPPVVSVCGIEAESKTSAASSVSLSDASLRSRSGTLNNGTRASAGRTKKRVDDLTIYLTCDMADVEARAYEICAELPQVRKLSVINKVPHKNAGDLDYPGIQERLLSWWKWVPYNLSCYCKNLTVEGMDFADTIKMFENGFFKNLNKFNFVLVKRDVIRVMQLRYPNFQRETEQKQVESVVDTFKQFLPNAMIQGRLD